MSEKISQIVLNDKFYLKNSFQVMMLSTKHDQFQAEYFCQDVRKPRDRPSAALQHDVISLGIIKEPGAGTGSTREPRRNQSAFPERATS